jgi:hypothetical protein
MKSSFLITTSLSFALLCGSIPAFAQTNVFDLPTHSDQTTAPSDPAAPPSTPATPSTPAAPTAPAAPSETPTPSPTPAPREKGKPGDQKGTIEAIDAEAGTFTVGGMSFNLSKVGKIYVDNVKSSLSELKVGDLVAVTYWPRSDGTNSATLVIKGHPGRKKSK